MFAMTPYAATPALPAMRRIAVLKISTTTAEEICSTKEGTPSVKQARAFFGKGRGEAARTVHFFVKKCTDTISEPITGDRPVARIAPNIPMPQGKINT